MATGCSRAEPIELRAEPAARALLETAGENAERVERSERIEGERLRERARREAELQVGSSNFGEPRGSVAEGGSFLRPIGSPDPNQRNPETQTTAVRQPPVQNVVPVRNPNNNNWHRPACGRG